MPSSTVLFPNKLDPDKPEYPTSLGHSVNRMCIKTGMNKWLAKDLRRTVKTWAGYAGISKEVRDRLQNHAITDVSSKHYDRHLYLRDKYDGLMAWEKFLRDEKILTDD